MKFFLDNVQFLLITTGGLLVWARSVDSFRWSLDRHQFEPTLMKPLGIGERVPYGSVSEAIEA
jgi:hypothetical protein